LVQHVIKDGCKWNMGGDYVGWFSMLSRMDVNGTWVEELVLKNWQVRMCWSNAWEIRFHNEKVETAVHEW